MEKTRLKSELGVGDAIGHAILWILLTIFTFGLAFFVYPYYMFRFIIGKTFVVDMDDKKIGRLVSTIDLASIIGNVVIWGLLSIVTFGLAYIVFAYKILSHCFNHTEVVPLPDRISQHLQ